MVKERDFIGAQLVRRNDELSLVNEKMKILVNTLRRGELQYKERLEDIRLLKLEIRRLRCKNTILERSAKDLDDLRFGKRITALCIALCPSVRLSVRLIRCCDSMSDRRSNIL